MPERQSTHGDFNPENIAPGDVFQIKPDFENKAFAACFVTVSEIKSFGIQGYVQALGKTRDEMGGQAYIRLKWEDIAYVGEAVWAVA